MKISSFFRNTEHLKKNQVGENFPLFQTLKTPIFLK